jgi:hypothetical protein
MRLIRFRRIPGRRAFVRGLPIALIALQSSSCLYQLRGGGGLPEEIRTVYIQSFENKTPQFELDQQLFSKLQEKLPRALGLRPGGEENADAVVRGVITRYEDVAQNYRPGDQNTRVQVELHQVQITVSVELINRKNMTVLWESQSLTGRGEYKPSSEQDVTARAKALDHILQQIIDGAQSQW